MLKGILVVALALTVTLSVSTGAANELMITEGHITEFKAILRLSADQEQYWAPVEAGLRDMARRPNGAATLDGKSVNRLVALALPLFRRLDPEQKRKLIMGVQPSGAEITYAWCAQYALQGSSNCGFSTLDQCRAALSGNGGYCEQNPMFRPALESAAAPRRRR